jgi:DNA-binding beta-propeller fold protein YncE
MRIPSLATLALTGCVGQAQYSGPESVEYDAVGDRYLVSCTGNNSIKQRAQDGAVTNFVTNLPDAPYGIEIKGDTLFANVGGSVMGFLLSTAAQVFNLDIGGNFLNGMTTDGHFLYVTDFNAFSIIKVDPELSTYSTLVQSTAQKPNGIVHDPAQNKLWVGFWGAPAYIRSYDPSTGAELSSNVTSLQNIDGITLDCDGAIMVSSWAPDHITRFDPGFTNEEVVIQTGLVNPADIDYDPVNDRVCVPNTGNNTVVVLDVPFCGTGVPEQPGYRTVNAIPNPTDGLVSMDLDMEEPQPFLVFNERGLLVASGTLRPRAMLDVRTLAAGIYMIDLPRMKRFVRVVKN